jgi:hypothetical protein
MRDGATGGSSSSQYHCMSRKIHYDGMYVLLSQNFWCFFHHSYISARFIVSTENSKIDYKNISTMREEENYLAHSERIILSFLGGAYQLLNKNFVSFKRDQFPVHW